jgi:hypothetical protein
MCKLKTKSLKRKVKTQNLKFIVLSFSFALFALHFALIVPFVFAQSISSTELINNAKQYDGKPVVYKGEAIGDIMVRGENAWINVNDGTIAIGIWIRKELIKDIVYTGSYKVKGDLVEITGKFNRACIEHGGDLDIHAQSLTKLSSGSKIFHLLNSRALNFALGLSGIIGLVWILRKKYKISSRAA